MNLPAFPKPGQQKRTPKYLCDDGVFRYPNGREVCQLTSKKGMDEYVSRKRRMWEGEGGRQPKTCCLCHLPLRWQDAMFEHQDGRGLGGSTKGGSQRDDRIAKPDPKTGEMKPYNGVAHPKCNSEKGSKRINYNLIEA